MFLLPEKSESFVVLIIKVQVITTDKCKFFYMSVIIQAPGHIVTDLILRISELGDEEVLIIAHVTEEEPELHK